MGEIKRIGIVGMGALGLLFGGMIADAAQAGRLDAEAAFLMDGKRLARHAGDRCSINGRAVSYPMRAPADFGPADLILVATKYGGLAAAVNEMAPCVKPDTVFVSLLNGISSERVLARRYGADHVLYAVAQEMDAQRYGAALTYTRAGRILLGVPKGAPAALAEDLRAVTTLFDAAGVPYGVEEDILFRMWGKFMLNVGINQTCMVLDTGYGGALEPGSEANAMFISAMREVILLANAEGIPLGEAQLKQYVDIVRRLDPAATPSMGQDRRQRRPSEVDIFAGEVIALGRLHGIPTPVNDYIYRRVKAIEAGYAGA